MDSIKPGMFINDRYEIIDKVGSGGMANVYKAKCHRLNRYVAIKVLKSEFSSDTNFIKKFRAEAQSVAGLSHPNIVSVYDVGDDDGLHYIVMELVEGITLKRFIERKQRLDVKEAVGIAIQICQGMEAAHNHHIIHRDIKPQNIIISRDGKVKVADFGIAKAASSFTLTQDGEGSVHYLSPEQARGGYSDERSDIYSLGVTMYEMLTGQVPFSGDNNVSVVLLHLQSEATPVTVLNPSVPHSVDMIVQKCMQKKPERRYQNVAELIADLRRSITDPDGDYVTITQNAGVISSDTRGITPEEIKELNNSSAQSHTVHYSRKNPQAPVRDYPVRERSNRNDELDQIGNPLVERIVTIVSIIAALGLIFLIFYLVKNSSWFGIGDNDPDTETVAGDNGDNVKDPDRIATPTTPLIVMPGDPTPTPTPIPDDAPENMVTMGKIDDLTLEEAVSLLKLLSPDFKITYSEEYNEKVDKGVVFGQEYPAGSQVNKYSEIKFKVSSGGEEFELEDVTGKGKNAAIKLLKGYKLNTTVLEEYSDEIPEGDVVRTEPEAGSFVSKDADIMVYVSLGPEIKTVSVPSLLGMTKKEAKNALSESFLILGTASEDYSDAYGKGLICGQSIAAGEVVGKDTVINFTVSLGSAPVTNPEPEPEPEPAGGDDTEPVG
jgi:serine/threonine-protein kinase